MKTFFANRIISFVCLACASLTGGYWWFFVHPYLWIYDGRVEAFSLEIKSPETGLLINVPVKVGEVVERGKPLFILENPQIKRELQASQSALEQLHKEELFYKNQSEQAMQNYLADLGVRSQSEVDLHLEKLHSAQLKINQVQEQLSLLLKEQVRLQEKEAAIPVSSPCRAVIIEQKKIAGALLQKEESVLSFFDADSSWIEMNVSEQELHLLEVGKPVDIYLTAYPKRAWKGTISRIGPATLSKTKGEKPTPNKELIPIHISAVSQETPLKPGLSAKVRMKK
ncbi:MAG: efflux RND transporter periplasmic adaptor subunit [Chlamydiales bacterium]|nr:efflux RND transporter periplasmic adaptor subunit [Chlamydiales bacterium]